MKATGIVRRLDDLGRLVIPKEIRKQYRLKEGDSIEFFIENDHIVIQKFDVLSKHLEEINLMVETLETMFHEPILFLQDEWLRLHQKAIDEQFLKSMQTHRISKFQQELVFQDEDRRYNGIVFPVVAFGDWFGAFVILFENRSYEIEELDAIHAFCELLTRQQAQ